LETKKIFDFFRKYMGKMVGARAGAEIFDKLEPEPHKNGPAPQHCARLVKFGENQESLSKNPTSVNKKAIPV
jgi:hypothetical protein